MNTSRLNERAERAWMRLENWARSWHNPDAPGYFAGSLGGASLSQVYFGGVAPEATVKLLTALDVEFQLARQGDGPNEASRLNPRNISSFLAGCDDDLNGRCSILAAARVPLPGGVFEPQIIIEKVPENALEILVTWVPLLAFLKTRELKDRFFDIFGWFFSVQQMLETEKILLCLERCPHPSTDSSAWIEI